MQQLRHWGIKNIREHQLSEEQKQINIQPNGTQNDIQRKHLQKIRNHLMRQIHQELAREKTEKIEKEIKEIEDSKEDSNRMFKAIKSIHRMKTKVPLVIEHDEGVTADTEKQKEIVSNFFEKMFNTEDAKDIENIRPRKMGIPFSEEEIRKAVKSLKKQQKCRNRRNTG